MTTLVDQIAGNWSCGMASVHLMGQLRGCLIKQAVEHLLGIGAALLCQHRLNATCLNLLLNCWNTPTYRCTGLLLLLFQPMKRNSKSKKSLTRILHSAHKCLAWQCLATTFWNIEKHARMSSSGLFLSCFCMFIVFLYVDGCNYLVQVPVVLRKFLPSLFMSSEKQ